MVEVTDTTFSPHLFSQCQYMCHICSGFCCCCCCCGAHTPCCCVQFFQKNDNTMNDAFMIATGVAALYLVYKVFEQIETL